MRPEADFWRGRKVFLTGHSGFKGAWLVLLLEQLGAEVIGYALKPPTEPSLFNLLSAKLKGIFLEADVRNRDYLSRCLTDSKASVAIHLAAQALVGPSYKEPADTFETNVMGTVNFLEALRLAPEVRAALIVTSDKCYENNNSGIPFRESDPMGGSDPYSASKGAAELVVKAYCRSFFEGRGPAIATARAGNVIGGGDWAENRLLPDMVRAFASQKPVNIRRPKAVRPWQHVLEPLAGYLSLLEKLDQGKAEYAGGWNFGPSDEAHWPVGQVVKTAAELWGPTVEVNLAQDELFPEAGLLTLNTDKAKNNLGWHSRLDLRQAIEMTLDWYKSYYLHTEDPIQKSISQIDWYLSKLNA